MSLCGKKAGPERSNYPAGHGGPPGTPLGGTQPGLIRAAPRTLHARGPASDSSPKVNVSPSKMRIYSCLSTDIYCTLQNTP